MGPSWGLNPGPSEYWSDALTTELLEPLGRGTVGKLSAWLVILPHHHVPTVVCAWVGGAVLRREI